MEKIAAYRIESRKTRPFKNAPSEFLVIFTGEMGTEHQDWACSEKSTAEDRAERMLANGYFGWAASLNKGVFESYQTVGFSEAAVQDVYYSYVYDTASEAIQAEYKKKRAVLDSALVVALNTDWN